MRKIVTFVPILICVILLASLGCASIVDRLTPASVAPRVPSYLGQEPQDIYSLHDTKLMRDDVLITHRDTQIDLRRTAEDDKLAYQDAMSFIDTAIAESELMQQKILGDDNNPLSVSGFLFALTGGMIGRSFFRRPGDLTADEARAKGAAV